MNYVNFSIIHSIFGITLTLSLHLQCKRREVTQSCLSLYDPMDCSPPDSLTHGIFQAWILEWVAISFSRGSSRPRNWTQVPRIVGRRFTIWVQSLAWEDPLEKGKGTHSSILAWRIPGTIQSMGSQRIGHHWVTFTSLTSLYLVNIFVKFYHFILKFLMKD